MPSVRSIAKQCVHLTSRQSNPKKLVDLIFEIVFDENELGTDEVYEVAEGLEKKVYSELSSIILQLNAEGKSCSFCFAQSDTYYIQGTDFINSDDVDEVRSAKLARQNLVDIQSSIASMTPNSFEQLMRRILENLGLTEVYISTSKSDDGIDFIGKLNLGMHSSSTLLQDHFLNEIELFVVGQAKRYIKSKFKLGELRELIGSVMLLRSDVSARANAQDWPFKLRISDPVVNLFVISNEISSSGWRLANASGVKLLDLDKLCVLIADLGIDLDSL